MAEFFDEDEWRKIIQQPDWYLDLVPEFQKLFKQAKEADETDKREVKEELYGFFENALEAGEVTLDNKGYNFDSDRQLIDTAVIHHTSEPPGLSLSRLNAMHLIRLYAPYFADPTLEKEKQIKGEPIYSGHFIESQQVFWAYHWLIRQDGTVERLLGDDEVGWHSGNWSVNCSSVAICFDDELTNKQPTPHALYAAKKVIGDNYPKCNLVGHFEINSKAECPGRLFKEWKVALYERQ